MWFPLQTDPKGFQSVKCKFCLTASVDNIKWSIETKSFKSIKNRIKIDFKLENGKPFFSHEWKSINRHKSIDNFPNYYSQLEQLLLCNFRVAMVTTADIWQVIFLTTISTPVSFGNDDQVTTVDKRSWLFKRFCCRF